MTCRFHASVLPHAAPVLHCRRAPARVGLPSLQWGGAVTSWRGATAAASAEGSEPDTRDALYEVLGVSPGASAEAVKRAYKRLALRFHPDVNKAPDASQQFTRLRLAYEKLQAGGGQAQRPWWRSRWLAQLRNLRHLRAVVRSKVGRVKQEPEDSEQAELEAELRRKRVHEQLLGLKERDDRRQSGVGRRRPRDAQRHE
jgi:hypothetical protein